MTADPDIATDRVPSAIIVESVRFEERIALQLLALLPGGVIVYLSFEAGGYFPGSVAFAVLLLTQVVLLRVLVARTPFAGFSRAHAVTAALFAAYAGWTLASGLWSSAPDRALTEFNRTFLYLLLLVLFGTLARRREQMRLMTRGVLAGALIVCICALITRLLPHVWPVSAGLAPSRLSFPLTYWNALGILAAIAVVLAAGLACDPAEPRLARTLAAAAVPIASVTLLLTFSRGSIVSLLVGLVVLAVICRSSALPGAAVAIVPPTAVAVVIAYHAKLLATAHPTSPAAVAQGHHVAIALAITTVVAGALRWTLTALDARLARTRTRRTGLSARTRWGAVAGALALVVVVAVVAGAPGFISREYHQFVKGAPVPTTNVSARLGNASANGRIALWHIALQAFSSAPLKGTGAGSYELDQYRYRSASELPVVDAHNLYLQTLAELGLIGLALLAFVLVAIMTGLARRIRGPDRVLYAALFSAGLAWAIHGAVDWDWQMPAVTAWLFAVGGGALAAETRSARTFVTDGRARVPLAVAMLVAAIMPLLILLSQSHLERSANAFQAGNCATAESQARASISALSDRAVPYMIIGYCDIQDGLPNEAVVAMQMAVEQEPGNWQYHYGLAIADGYAGVNPRPALLATLRLDPKDQLFDPLRLVLRPNSRPRWLAAAKAAYGAVLVSGRLTLQ
jgi:O-Antigen ligase